MAFGRLATGDTKHDTRAVWVANQAEFGLRWDGRRPLESLVAAACERRNRFASASSSVGHSSLSGRDQRLESLGNSLDSPASVQVAKWTRASSIVSLIVLSGLNSGPIGYFEMEIFIQLDRNLAGLLAFEQPTREAASRSLDKLAGELAGELAGLSRLRMILIEFKSSLGRAL